MREEDLFIVRLVETGSPQGAQSSRGVLPSIGLFSFPSHRTSRFSRALPLAWGWRGMAGSSSVVSLRAFFSVKNKLRIPLSGRFRQFPSIFVLARYGTGMEPVGGDGKIELEGCGEGY